MAQQSTKEEEENGLARGRGHMWDGRVSCKGTKASAVGWEGHSMGERTTDAENGGWTDGWVEWGAPLL